MDQYNYNSRRAREARFGKVANTKAFWALIILAIVALLGLGGALIYLRNSWAWFTISMAAPLIMLLVWMKHEVKHIPIGQTESVNDLLSRECMQKLPAKPTTNDIAKFVSNTRSGRFLAARYDLFGSELEAIASTLDQDPAKVFAKAREIRKATDSEMISGGILGVALVECFPASSSYLKQKKLEITDLYDGLNWFNYLNNLSLSYKVKRHTGGFGRDLMFGYTPLLSRLATNISAQYETRFGASVSIRLHKEMIDKMTQIFSSGGRQNVAIIGPEGSGRSTAVHDFAESILNADNKIPSNLKFRQIYKLDASAMISAASGRGELEALMTRLLYEALNAKNVILWLDNAQLFFEEGTGSVDISNLLTPILQGGRLRIILTMNQQRYLEIAAKNSTLANALNKIMVESADKEKTFKVMQDRVILLEHQHNVYYTFWALAEAYRLSERYVFDLAMPGRAISLLESAAAYAEGGRVDDRSVRAAIEATNGVKLGVTQSSKDTNKLLNLEQHIHERMIGQEGAVKSVSDALRRAAAGVRNQNRPIGTFLFLGPTGVGKTELAKSISEAYFGGEGQIVRLDLNEFVTENDVQRLIADGASDEMSLTAQVMKHPFSVVLLDEIEKAHPLVLTTLLQLLDEGILRDAKNHEVSFRDAIIIATSNAGANRIREYIDEGLSMEQMKEELTNELIKTGEFKPEFINRFDEVCVFRPLTKEELFKIVQLIVESTNKTLEPRKISVSLTDGAIAMLVDRGYDPKLGARPMRRIVQKTVENIVAKSVLTGSLTDGSNIDIDEEMIKEQLI